ALTSSFCIDILGLKRRPGMTEARGRRIRLTVHATIAALFFALVMGFKAVDNKSIIDVILKVAGFTYGPLLGLFAFGILTRRTINDRLSLAVCLTAPLLILGVDLVNNIDWYARQLNLAGEQVDAI